VDYVMDSIVCRGFIDEPCRESFMPMMDFALRCNACW
jgi:hypothetical protein